MQLPEENDFLLFPGQAGELIKIAWYQQNVNREAQYYCTPAYTFKKGPSKPQPDGSIAC